MKKTILGALALLAALTGRAQEFGTQISIAAPGGKTVSSAARTPTATERTEWLSPFEAVEIDATADVRFVEVATTETPRIIYDTKGDSTTKFRAEVRNNVLRIRERADSRRTARTTATVYYNSLRSLTLTDADAVFETLLSAPMFDLTVGARSTLQAQVDIQDLKMELSGNGSRAVLSGQVRYLTLEASTGRVVADDLVCESAVVTAKNKARVTLDATDRLEAKTSLSGTIGYKREPNLLRTSQSLLAGDIARIE